jgi:hypothetical protein
MINSRKLRFTEQVARMGRKGMHIRLRFRKPEGKIPLGRLEHRWEDNIKIDLKR